MKSTKYQSEYSRVKVTAKADAIDITGAEKGEIVKVYNNVGIAVRSTVTTNEVLKIKLLINQIYSITVGGTSYKVAL